MKNPYIYMIAIALIMYNGFLIRRDRKMFEAYDKVCAELTQPNPNCRYSKNAL